MLNCQANTTFNFVGFSSLFANISIPFSFQDASNVTCEYYITIFFPEQFAIETIQITSTNPMDWAVLQFSIAGFAINSLAGNLQFSASSNSQNASVVNVLSSSYWQPEEQVITYIQMSFNTTYYPNYTRIVFYEAGQFYGNVTRLPSAIYFQGWINNRWISLAQIGVYAPAGSWAERIIKFPGVFQSYSAFRLISIDGPFSVRYWQVYSLQVCNCTDGSDLTLSLPSLDGLETLSKQLLDLQAFDTANPNAGCIAINNCTIEIAPGIFRNLANDGVCQDAKYIASIMNFQVPLEKINTTYYNVSTGNYWLVTPEVFPGISTVQFTSNTSLYFNITQLQAYYVPAISGTPYPYLNPSSNGTGSNPLAIYYFNSSTYQVVTAQQNLEPFSIITYLNGTVYFRYDLYETNYQELVTLNLACPVGYDTSDCGSSLRFLPLQPEVQCTYSAAQATLKAAIENTTIIVNQTYYITNLSSLTDTSWKALYEFIPLTRRTSVVIPNNCPGQVCPGSAPFRCANGLCVNFANQCNITYTCPGNGCVKQTDATSDGVSSWRCVCKPGFSGDACQYGQCTPATPYLPITALQVTPAAGTCACGGLPPFKIKPPWPNLGKDYTNDELVAINTKWTANSGRKSVGEIAYLNVMPSFGWGVAVRRQVVLSYGSNILSSQQRIIYTDCPCARLGSTGEQFLLDDDVLTRDPITGVVTAWKPYKNPAYTTDPTAPEFITYEWVKKDICSFDDVPFRCPNGQCQPNEKYCANSAVLAPLCNGRGTCMADGTCKCLQPYRTYFVNDKYSLLASYPYAVTNGIPNPAVWELNLNFRNHGLTSCLARDCTASSNVCTVPIGCFPGTPSLNFADKLLLCPTYTGRQNYCAPSAIDCSVGSNLQYPIACSGKGILKTKDLTGEPYCACGDPISPLVNISSISQITELQPNGWGGVACDYYEAPAAPLVYSQYNFEVNDVYYSAITNEVLPGKFIEGVAIVGPDPDDHVAYQACCEGFLRLELCPKILCQTVSSGTQCVLAQDCMAPDVPKIYRCNNHGTARADGTCECDSDAADGSGYGPDYTQFSYDGCYARFTCVKSVISKTACQYYPACSNPEQWRYPVPDEPYLEQQVYSCGSQQGPITNTTILSQISTSTDLFLDQLIEALTVIALAVIEEREALLGCRCDYPNDTQYMKYGMLPGSNDIYEQSYSYSYFINGTVPEQPQLTDGTLEAYGYESLTMYGGDSFSYVLQNNASTNITAIRIYANATKGGTFTFTTSTGTACQTLNFNVTAQTTDPTELYLEWIPGGSQAHYCGPTYQCLTFQDDPNYFYYCRDPTSVTCSQWLSSSCLQTPNAYYWPTYDTSNVYQGCNRADGGAGQQCVCCGNPFLGGAVVKDGVVKVTFDDFGTGSIAVVGQIRLFGQTPNALPLPSNLKTYLGDISGVDTDCQDYLYIQGILNSNNNFFSPRIASADVITVFGTQNAIGYLDTYPACESVAGFTATALGTLGAGSISVDESGAIQTMQQACNNSISQIDNSFSPVCWVGAKDTVYIEQYIDRDDVIEPNCETCYMSGNNLALGTPSGYAAAFNYWPISFSTYPKAPWDPTVTGNNWKTPFYSNQKSSYTNIQNIPPGILTQLMYSNAPDQACQVIITFNVIIQIQNSVNTLTIYLSFAGIKEGPATGSDTPFPYADATWVMQRQDPQTITNDGKIVPGFSATYTSSAPIYQVVQYGGSTNNLVQLVYNAINDKYPETINVYTTATIAQWWTIETASVANYACFRVAMYVNTNCVNDAFNKEIGNSQNPGVDIGLLLSGNPNFQTPETSGRPYYIYVPSCDPVFTRYNGSDRGYNCQTDPSGNDISNTASNQYTNTFCARIFPFNLFQQVVVNKERTYVGPSLFDYGKNWFPSSQDYEYLPVFLSVQIVKSIDPVIGQVNGVANPTVVPQVDGYELNGLTPVYFIDDIPITQIANIVQILKAAVLPTCDTCYKQLLGNYVWNDYIYNADNAWVNKIATPLTTAVAISNGAQQYFLSFTLQPSVPDIYTFVHQTTYLQGRAAQETRINSGGGGAATYNISMPNCVIVTASSLQSAFCNHVHNYFCVEDYIKMAYVTGSQCPPCGCSTRPGGTPEPGTTCYDAHPLANATKRPYENNIADNYIRGTLYDYASQYLPEGVDLLGNTSVFWGIESCWEYWQTSFSSRGPLQGGVNTQGVPISNNWKDLCLKCNWPYDCGTQADPITNVPVRYCATTQDYCDLTKPLPKAGLMNPSYIPTIYQPVDPLVAASNPTCGYPVLLGQFVIMDKYGAPQSSVLQNATVIESSDTDLKIQVINYPANWYNGGKTTNHYKFNWTYATTIAGQYQIVDCVGCPEVANMQVMIYPINTSYSFPTTYLYQNVSLDQSGNLVTYEVTFQITVNDTGIVIINGQEFPAITFEGVGFLFPDLGVGSVIYLTNPILSDPISIGLCLNRSLPNFVEPSVRIKSTSPNNVCISSVTLQAQYPGSALGDCACDVSRGGYSCDCLSTITAQFGSAVCANFGDDNVGVLAFDGQTYQTRGGLEAGCYITADNTAECKLVNIGTAGFTLLVPGAVWNYPSVYIDVPPITGQSIFSVLDNTLQTSYNYTTAQTLCSLSGSRLAYFLTPDELTQFAVTTIGLQPAFISLLPPTSEITWPWDNNIVNSFFINGLSYGADTIVPVADVQGDFICGSIPDVCAAVNFNNYAYGANCTDPALVDGNTVMAVSVSSGTLQWESNGPSDVYIAVFGNLNVACGDANACVTLPSTSTKNFHCRCAIQTLTYSGTSATEIQVFYFYDNTRVTAYYN